MTELELKLKLPHHQRVSYGNEESYGIWKDQVADAFKTAKAKAVC